MEDVDLTSPTDAHLSQPHSSSPTPIPPPSSSSSSHSLSFLSLPCYASGRRALMLLTAINLINFMDRYAPSAIKELIKADLNLTDSETSLPYTSFLIVYVCFCPVFAHWADIGHDRKKLLAIGIAAFSLASAMSALAVDFYSYLFTRSCVGVGEAAYSSIAPALLAQFFPQSLMSRVLAIFYLAVPVGAALGFVTAGLVGSSMGWRAAFLVIGMPGMALALVCLKLKMPDTAVENGQSSAQLTTPDDVESPPPSRPTLSTVPSGDFIPWRATLLSLSRNRHFMFSQVGSTLNIFAAGALADWAASYFHRVHGMDIDTASSVMGASTVAGGVLGTFAGAWAGDYFHAQIKNSYYVISSVTSFIAAFFCFLLLMVASSTFSVVFLSMIMQIFLWCYIGPNNATLSGSVSHAIRSRAFAVSIIMNHLLGDSISPAIVGGISDSTGSLQSALLIVPAALIAAGLVFAWAAYALPQLANESDDSGAGADDRVADGADMELQLRQYSPIGSDQAARRHEADAQAQADLTRALSPRRQPTSSAPSSVLHAHSPPAPSIGADGVELDDPLLDDRQDSRSSQSDEDDNQGDDSDDDMEE